MPNFDVEELSPDANARIVKSVVSPRPIAWISTIDDDGVENLAPFSSYNYVSSSRPVVLFNSPVGEDGELKDTPRNAIDTGEFAVNVVTEELAEAMDATSAALASDESEFEFASVDRAPCERIAAPRVADAAATFECTLYDTLRVHDRLMVLGEAIHVHVDDRILTDGEIDMRKLNTVGRLGGPYYTVSDRIELERQY